jgi:hypothetical protein
LANFLGIFSKMVLKIKETWHVQALNLSVESHQE